LFCGNLGSTIDALQEGFAEVSVGLSGYSFEACEDLGPRGVEKEEGVGQNDDAGFWY
jgi:hypothetical protein